MSAEITARFRAWIDFRAWMGRVQLKLEPEWLPVAVVALRADEVDGEIRVRLDDEVSVVWPPSFPVPERAALVERIAKAYVGKTVKRVDVHGRSSQETELGGVVQQRDAGGAGAAGAAPVSEDRTTREGG